MIRALYTATSGMILQAQKLDLTSENLYHASIPGFKAFKLLQASREPTPGAVASDVQTRFEGQFVGFLRAFFPFTFLFLLFALARLGCSLLLGERALCHGNDAKALAGPAVRAATSSLRARGEIARREGLAPHQPGFTHYYIEHLFY